MTEWLAAAFHVESHGCTNCRLTVTWCRLQCVRYLPPIYGSDEESDESDDEDPNTEDKMVRRRETPFARSLATSWRVYRASS